MHSTSFFGVFLCYKTKVEAFMISPQSNIATGNLPMGGFKWNSKQDKITGKQTSD
jgi:hypothetical protein